MVIILSVANESNSDFSFHGENVYLLSKGRTIESAKNNVVKYLKEHYYYYEFENDVCNGDITNLLISKFERWQDGKDSWEDEESWINLFPDFCFPRSTEAKVWEIPEEMYDKIIELIS